MHPVLDTISVLHVDDEPDFAAIAVAFLEREDDRFEIETATSVSEGLERLNERTFDCVISDYDLPGQNGIEFLEAVRDANLDLPFILFTGKGSEEVASEAISAGVSDYLQKETGTSQYTLLANRVLNAVEQYRNRVALEESEKRLSLFIEQSPLGVIEYNENFEIVRLNAAGEEILGYTEAELRGETWEVLVTESSYQNVVAVTEALMEASGGFHSVDENVRKDGTHIVCEWHNRVVTDEDGTVVAIFSQFQDITDRTEHERELESTRRRLEAILKNTTTPMFMKDEEGGYLFVNQGFRELFGLQDEELVGHTDYDLFDEAVATDIVANDREVLERGEPVETEERIVVDGRERTFLSTKAPIYDTGERSDPDTPVAVFGVAVDITDRNARERELQRYENIVNTMREAACIYDEDGRFVLVNAYLAAFYGTTTEALEGEQSRLLPVIRADGERDRYQELLDGERDELRGEIEVDVRDRGSEILSYRLLPLRIDGEIEGAIAVAHEITEYRARERELERKNAQLESFTGVVSHDLRSPLQVATARIRLASEECDSHHLDAAETALDRSQELIDGLLALARDGELVRETDAVDLRTLVEACWDAVAVAVASDRTLVVETTQTVYADRNRLRQLLENLFRNSIEHGSTGNRTVQSSRESVEHGSRQGQNGSDAADVTDGGETTVTVGDLPEGFYVADDGPGIPSTERERVFETGYSTSTDGAGFGLAIVKEIADAHGWTVSVTESEAGGARFEIRGVVASRTD